MATCPAGSEGDDRPGGEGWAERNKSWLVTVTHIWEWFINGLYHL